VAKEFKLPYKMGTWEEAEAMVGQELRTEVGVDKVEVGSIRRRLEAIEFDCPLHYDEETAKEVGFDGIIAPYTMAITYAAGPYWRPGDPPAKLEDMKIISMPILEDVPAPTTLSFATDFDVEFFTPMYAGDEITSTTKFKELMYKELKVGKGAFFVQETTYKNQRGEIVAVSNITIFRFTPPERAEKGGE